MMVFVVRWSFVSDKSSLANLKYISLQPIRSRIRFIRDKIALFRATRRLPFPRFEKYKSFRILKSAEGAVKKNMSVDSAGAA